MPTKNRKFPVSRRLASTAAVLWLISLALPAFVLFGGGDSYWGFVVLIEGWLGVLMAHIAWFANIFVLYAIMKLRVSENSVIRPAVIATLLSLDTFLVKSMPTGPGESPILGLTLGATIWLCSIYLTQVAAFVREFEVRADDSPHQSDVGRALKNGLFPWRTTIQSSDPLHRITSRIQWSVFLLATFVCTIIGLAMYDRLLGNEDENELLNRSLVLFKRGEVCRFKPPPLNRILLRGPLEVANNDTSLLTYPDSFLRMGIPVVRIEKEEFENGTDSKGQRIRIKAVRDYYLENMKDPSSIRWKLADGPYGAQLDLRRLPNVHNDRDPTMAPQYSARLVSDQGEVGFDIELKRQYSQIVCPHVNDSRNLHYSLEKLVKEALVIGSKK